MLCSRNGIGVEIKRSVFKAKFYYLMAIWPQTNHFSELQFPSAKYVFFDFSRKSYCKPNDRRVKSMSFGGWQNWVWILHQDLSVPWLWTNFFSSSHLPIICELKRLTLPPWILLFFVLSLTVRCIAPPQFCRFIPGYIKIPHLRQMLHSRLWPSSFFLNSQFHLIAKFCQFTPN